jgi:hypothetical protein
MIRILKDVRSNFEWMNDRAVRTIVGQIIPATFLTQKFPKKSGERFLTSLAISKDESISVLVSSCRGEHSLVCPEAPKSIPHAR